jgi:hypothetical protein
MGLAYLDARGGVGIDSRVLQRLAQGSAIHQSLLEPSKRQGIPLTLVKSRPLYLCVFHSGFKGKASTLSPVLTSHAVSRGMTGEDGRDAHQIPYQAFAGGL